MKSLFTAGAARIAAQIQNFGVNFDYEVLSLPGGSAIAIVLWLYSSTVAGLRRGGVVASSEATAPKPKVAQKAPLSLNACTGGCK